MNDYTFASALLTTRSANLLSKNQFRDLKGSDDQTFVHKLQSFGYGVSLKNVLVDALAESELIKLKEELLEIIPNDDVVMFFFTRYDLTNIRNYYKNKRFKIDISGFENAGFLTEKDLDKAILRDDFYGVVEPFKTLFSLLSTRSYTSVGELVNDIQVTFQDLLFERIQTRKDESLMTYFVISTDIANLLTLLRIRHLKLGMTQLRLGLLNHGLLEASDITLLLECDEREIVNRYSSLYMTRFASSLNRFFENHDFVALEHDLLNVLLDELKPFQVDITCSAALIEYVIRKQIEITDLRRLYIDRNAVLMVNA